MLSFAICAAVLAVVAWASIMGAVRLLQSEHDGFPSFLAFMALGTLGIGSGVSSFLICLFVLTH